MEAFALTRWEVAPPLPAGYSGPDFEDDPHQVPNLAGDCSVITGRVPPGDGVEADGHGAGR